MLTLQPWQVALGGNVTQPAVFGRAVFTDLRLGPAGLYRLRFLCGALETYSNNLILVSGPPAQLGFVQTVASATRAGATIEAQPAVAVQVTLANAPCAPRPPACSPVRPLSPLFPSCASHLLLCRTRGGTPWSMMRPRR